MKYLFTVFMFFGAFITLQAQTESECGCPEWNGTVMPELTVDPCFYQPEGPDDSMAKFAEWDCCMRKCKARKQQEKEQREKEYSDRLAALYARGQVALENKDYQAYINVLQDRKALQAEFGEPTEGTEISILHYQKLLDEENAPEKVITIPPSNDATSSSQDGNSSNKMDGTSSSSQGSESEGFNQSNGQGQNNTATDNPESNRAEQQAQELERLLEKQRIEREREAARQQAVAQGAGQAIEGISAGAEAGVFTGLEFSYNFRLENEDAPSFGVVGNSTYELAIVVGDKRNGYFSIGYGPAEASIYDDASGSVYNFGAEFDLFKIGENFQGEGKHNARLSIGGEYGLGSIEYSDEIGGVEETWEVDGSYYGGHVSLKFGELLVLKYGIGAFTGTTDRDNTFEDLEGGYSKLSIGLRLLF